MNLFVKKRSSTAPILFRKFFISSIILATFGSSNAFLSSYSNQALSFTTLAQPISNSCPSNSKSSVTGQHPKNKREKGNSSMSIFSKMFASTSVDPATNLAKTPAMDKTKSDADWSNLLNPTQFKVLRNKATEPRLVTVAKGGWDDHFEKGTYVCQGCKTPLYTSDHKFDCGCGWPGFWTNIKDAVYEKRDADGFRSEILCAHCDGHLGHVFRGEGFGNPAPNERHCVNGVALGFIPEGKTEEDMIPSTYEGSVYGG